MNLHIRLSFLSKRNIMWFYATKNLCLAICFEFVYFRGVLTIVFLIMAFLKMAFHETHPTVCKECSRFRWHYRLELSNESSYWTKFLKKKKYHVILCDQICLAICSNRSYLSKRSFINCIFKDGISWDTPHSV